MNLSLVRKKGRPKKNVRNGLGSKGLKLSSRKGTRELKKIPIRDQ